ncbi:MAG: hypothetical protein QM523_02580 [Candidatus Pacebacteria bacterium]|nr:hypothetical protein [Candidatus Paceibacterota bacterium]
MSLLDIQLVAVLAVPVLGPCQWHWMGILYRLERQQLLFQKQFHSGGLVECEFGGGCPSPTCDNLGLEIIKNLN